MGPLLSIILSLYARRSRLAFLPCVERVAKNVALF